VGTSSTHPCPRDESRRALFGKIEIAFYAGGKLSPMGNRSHNVALRLVVVAEVPDLASNGPEAGGTNECTSDYARHGEAA
jgi:hypothetical protein